MNRKVVIIGIAIVLPFLAILFVSLGRNPHKVESPLVGRRAPEFSLTQIGGNGTRFDLREMKGKSVVVNFWATWCVPCFEEHRVLTAGAEEVGSQVAFIGVAYNDSDDKIREFLRINGETYPTLKDPGGKTAIAYGVYGVPETFFIDRNGTIRIKHEGPVTTDVLRTNLRKLM